MEFRETIESNLKLMQRLQQKIENELEQLPSGIIVHKKSKGYEYDYLQTDQELISIKKHPEVLEQQRIREELSSYHAALQHNIDSTEEYLKNYIPLKRLFFNWEEIASESNHYKEENKVHSYKNVYYRSKSELTIAMFLHSYEIEFKYETSFLSHGKNIYPDFLIKRPKDNKLFVWEHFGLINDTEYRNKMYQKLISYHEMSFDLWDNLIISFDKENGSINADYIDTLIHLFLL